MVARWSEDSSLGPGGVARLANARDADCKRNYSDKVPIVKKKTNILIESLSNQIKEVPVEELQ